MVTVAVPVLKPKQVTGVVPDTTPVQVAAGFNPGLFVQALLPQNCKETPVCAAVGAGETVSVVALLIAVI